MVQWGFWGWIPPLPPFSCYSIISEKIFGLELMFSFTFFTYLLDELTGYTKPQIKHAFVYFFCQALAKQIFGYFKLRFHNELLHWQKNRFLVFFRTWLHLHVRKISTLSFKQYQIANCKLQGYWIKIGLARKGKFFHYSRGEKLSPSTLQLVEIYFDTATFDDIERDKKIKTEAQLSLIGGTIGLLTGFSIIWHWDHLLSYQV